MTDAKKLARLIAEIAAIARLSTVEEMNDEYKPGDVGDFDDAYNDGVEDGRVTLARELLDLYNEL